MNPMPRRILKAIGICGFLVGLCALTSIGSRGGESWVRLVRMAPPGNAPVRILHFYSTAGSIRAGETALLCYGVENAKSVELAPMMEGLQPAANRCLEVVPLHTTHYTILAKGFDGHVAMKSLTLPVNTAPERNAAPANPVHLAAWVLPDTGRAHLASKLHP